jgi:hypothetical protein
VGGDRVQIVKGGRVGEREEEEEGETRNVRGRCF